MWRSLGMVALAVLAVLGLIWILQRRLIYFPTQEVPDLAAVLPEAEEVTFPTEDGLNLRGWLVPARGGDDGLTVVVFNGNAGNRASRAPLAAAFARHGFGVLLFDYRGYGGNRGNPTESGLAADARATVSFLEALPEPTRLVYFGESLGAAVALRLAEERPPAALVLRSPFTSLADLAAVHYPLLPASLLLRDKYDNLERVTAVEAPVLVIAGSTDSIVPTEQSRRLYEIAKQPKQLVVIEGARHNDYELAAGAEMVSQAVSFIDRHAGS